MRGITLLVAFVTWSDSIRKTLLNVTGFQVALPNFEDVKRRLRVDRVVERGAYVVFLRQVFMCDGQYLSCLKSLGFGFPVMCGWYHRYKRYTLSGGKCCNNSIAHVEGNKTWP